MVFGFRNPVSDSARYLVVLSLVMLGLLMAGCSTQVEKDLRSEARALKSSGQFSQVTLQTENDKPWTNNTKIRSFTADVTDEADLTVVGKHLAESALGAGYVPDVFMGGSTWLVGFQDTYRWKTTAELSDTTWTEILEVARETQASEVDVWRHDGERHEDDNRAEHNLTLRTATPTYAEGLATFEGLAETPIPAEIGQLCIQLDAGIPGDPLRLGSRWGHEKPFWPSYPAIYISGPVDTDILKARQLIDAAEEHLDPIQEFSFLYWGPTPAVQVAFTDPEASSYFYQEQIPGHVMDNAEAYAEEVQQILGADVDITIEAVSPTDTSATIYRQGHPDLEDSNNPYGCTP